MFGDRFEFGAPEAGSTTGLSPRRGVEELEIQLRRYLDERGVFGRAALHRALSEVGSFGTEPLSDEELCRRVARLVGDGLLRSVTSIARADVPLLPLDEHEEREESPEHHVEAVGVHWIEIVLVGEDERPIPGVAYEVKDPDGRTHRGRLDGDGRARITSIRTPGSCQVTFPELDQEAWVPA